MGKKTLARAALLLGICAAVFTGVVWTANASSSAVDVQATPNRCGAGYTQIDSHRLTFNGASWGYVYLYYNSANGNNCAFTEKLVDRGIPTSVTVRLCRQSDGVCVYDPVHGEPFQFFAGPVYLHAPNTCIRWGGSVTDSHDRTAGWMSGWEHCG